MKLKLLQRREIDGIKAKERQLEINEGAKLAKRVDNLRELQAKEETGLASWRINTIATIQSEISEKEKELKIIDKALVIRKMELEHAFKPLREKEQSLAKEQERLNISFIEVELQKANLDEVIQSNEAMRALNAKELMCRASERQQNEQLLTEAQEELREAEDILTSSKEQAKSLRENAKSINTRAVKRENEVAQWQRELEIKANLLVTKEEELEKRELDVIVKELQFNSPIHDQRHNPNLS